MKLILTVGIPGSGKTTWAKKFCQDGKFVRISPDDIRGRVGSSISDMTHEYAVWKIVEAELYRLLDSGQNVVFDATNVKGKNRKMPVRIAKELGAEIHYAIFECSPEVAKERIRKDLEEKVDRSNVPDHVVDTMYENYRESLETIKKGNYFIVKQF